MTLRYEPVVNVFRQNFEQGFEREGAHLAIYYKGRQVVNVWNGFSDSESQRKWTMRTKTVFYSATKAISSLCVAMLVDRGRLSYDDLVVEYWPEYGQFGKENTTIEDVLTHKAGIPYMEDVTMEDVANQELMMHKIESAKPLWTPGTATGYHAITFGWLLDGIVQKADEKGRNIRTFFREEVAEKYGIDISIGLPKHEYGNLARATQPGLFEYARDILADPRMLAMLALMYLRMPDSIAAKLRMHPSWIPLNYDTVALNDPDVVSLNMGAVTGVGNADNFARLFSLALDGTLISNRTLQLIAQPTVANWHLEQVVLYPLVKGRGFFFEPHPSIKGAYLLGHPGYGGQSLNVDVERRLVIAYVSNGLKTGTGEMCSAYQRILRTVFNVID
uniref:Beta-lactamase domain-containing protein 2 n=2 Tax=Ascaris TaxID=6251 RepID=F1L324_ASCSU